MRRERERERERWEKQALLWHLVDKDGKHAEEDHKSERQDPSVGGVLCGKCTVDGA